MRFETLVLIIIAFNVVTAVLQRRAKKKRAQEAQERAARAPIPEEMEDDLEEAWEPESARREVPTRAPQQMPSLGRDILDQIARDLGLKTPKPAAPEPWSERPEPVIVAERPESRPAPEPAPVRSLPQPAVEKPVFEAAYTTPRAAEVPAYRVAPSQAPRRSPAPREAPPSRKIPTSVPTPRVNLRDVSRLREAFILKEVLGEPVSRRRDR